VLLAIVGSLMFLPIALSTLLAPRISMGAQLGTMRRYGPLALCAYCILNVLLSSGDRAVYYTQSEVNFLFSGPYRPRQLLLYKIVGGTCAALLTSVILAMLTAQHAALFSAAYLGIFLALDLLYFFSLSVGLVISTIGALAFDRVRKLLLLGLGLVGAAVIFQLGHDVWMLSPWEIIDRMVRSPTLSVMLGPFRPAVLAFASSRVWPDLVRWCALGLLVDLGLLVLVLGLNAQFLEASAAASAKLYAKIQRARRGALWVSATKAHFEVPMAPWCGGVGPNLWRQLTTATRSPARLLLLLLLFLLIVGAVLLGERGGLNETARAAPALSALIGVALFAPAMVGYDFRPDAGRMEDLKTLPIAPNRLVLGQLLTPVLVLCVGEWIAMALVVALTQASITVVAATAALAIPCNLMLIAIENLYFLWFPTRLAGVNSFDFQALGRQLLLMMAKMASIAVAAGLAAAIGAAVFYVAGGNWGATIIAAWFVMGACALALVPLVAVAFVQFDVAGSPPE
jgi:hypothetical protein